MIPSLMLFAVLLLAPPSAAEVVAQDTCDFSDVRGAVWWGTDRHMTLERFTSYIAPMYWFSPDEPSLYGKEGPEIIAPEPCPFDPTPGPVAYYQMKELISIHLWSWMRTTRTRRSLTWKGSF